MLVFHSHCQMGNQMFIYACARSLARKKNVGYCLSDLSHLKYFELSESDKKNNRKYFWFKLSNKIPGLKYKFEHMQDNRINYVPQMIDNTGKRVWYYGYFQGEEYFFQNANDLANCFKIKSEYISQFEKFKSSTFNTKRIIAVHIRLKDYKTFGPDFLNGPDLTLPIQYYKENLDKQLAAQKDNNYQIVILSDDIEEVKKEFRAYNAYFSEQNMITDFQILQHAYVAIISPSSYAWWACWLNKIPNKKIIVPKYFLGFKVKMEFPVNIIPTGFEQSEVNLL